jgi:hypothetical protein
MTPFRLVVAILAAFRLTSFLTYEGWTETLRARAGVDFVDEFGVPTTFWGKVLGCFWCVSLLAGVLTVGVAYTPAWWLLLPLACSAGAILLNHIARIYLYMER